MHCQITLLDLPEIYLKLAKVTEKVMEITNCINMPVVNMPVC